MLQRVYDDLRNNTQGKKIIEEKEIIFANISLTRGIQNEIFSLEPIYINKEINTYLLTYKFVEQEEGAGNRLNPIARKELVEEIIILLTLIFNGIFITDKEYLQKLLRTEATTTNDTIYPRKVCKYIFEPKIYKEDDRYQQWEKFLEAYLHMDKEPYKKITPAIKQYYTSLMTMSFNLEITYASFVAVLESLTQKLDEYENRWEDLYEPQRLELEEKFNAMLPNDVDDIKHILLTYAHNKLAKRYKEFCRSIVDNNYFLKDAEGVKSPCLKREINNCIDNSYDIRSRYVHELEELPEKFLWTYEAETVDIDNKVYFTVQGLVRFTRYALIKVVNVQIKTKAIDRYKDELLPGIIVVPLIEGFAPQHWVCDPKSFSIVNLYQYFNGILMVYAEILEKNKKEVPPLFEICNIIEKLLGGTHEANQIVLLVIYKLFYDIISETQRSPKYEQINKKYARLLEVPSMPMLVYYLLFDKKIPWSIEETQKLYELYCKKYYNKNSIKLPKLIETIVLRYIINKLDNTLEYKNYLEQLIGINPGNSYLDKVYNEYSENNVIQKIDIELI